MKKANSLQEEDTMLLGFAFSPPPGNSKTHSKLSYLTKKLSVTF